MTARRRRGTAGAAVAVVLASCAAPADPARVLDDLDDTPLACVTDPATREQTAGCDTAGGALVVSEHGDRGEVETAAALHLGEDAAGRLVDGGSWLLLAEDEQLAVVAAELLDARVVTSLQQVTGGCPDDLERSERLRDALGDPGWCP
jgi:hypothetical protein